MGGVVGSECGAAIVCLPTRCQPARCGLSHRAEPVGPGLCEVFSIRFAVVASFCCVARVTRMLGGPQAFRALVASAIEKSLNIIVQMSPSVSATRAHRRYNGMFTHIINDAGVRVPHPGSDGRFNQWEDQALLNYRKLAVWNLLLEEVRCICNCVLTYWSVLCPRLLRR
jgi:hypothetical protein